MARFDRVDHCWQAALSAYLELPVFYRIYLSSQATDVTKRPSSFLRLPEASCQENSKRAARQILRTIEQPAWSREGDPRQQCRESNSRTMELLIVLGAFSLAVTVAVIVFMHLDHA